MDGGWIKIFRKLLHSLVWQDPGLCRLFIWCLLRANWSDTELFFGRHAEPIKLHRGQFVTGRHAMHHEVYPRKSKNNPSLGTVYAQLKRLASMGLIEVESNNQFTTVTVVMFDTYQTMEDNELTTSRQRADNELTTSRQRADTDKKKQEKKEQLRTVKKQKAPQAAVVFPPVLDVPEFREAWSEWETHRKQKNKPLTEMSIVKSLAKCDRMGVKAAIEMIDYTIEKGWQGLREPDLTHSAGNGAPNYQAPNYQAKEPQ